MTKGKLLNQLCGRLCTEIAMRSVRPVESANCVDRDVSCKSRNFARAVEFKDNDSNSDQRYRNRSHVHAREKYTEDQCHDVHVVTH
jgi:hypothetical protein